MRALLAAARAQDRWSERLGRGVAWLSLAMVLVGAFNAVARYAGRFLGQDLSRNTYVELQWYLFSALFLLGAADALRRDAHVRVDVFYGRLSARGRAWIDLLGTVFLLLPFCALCLWVSGPYVASSFAVREASPDPGGLPRWPIKALLPAAFLLLLLQGLSELVKRASLLRSGGPAREEPPA